MKCWKRAVWCISHLCNMSWSVPTLNCLYGDHFTIEGHQKATFWKSELWVLFSRQWFEYISTTLATHLPYATFRFNWQTLQTLLQYCFLFGPASPCFSQRLKVFNLFSHKKYENSLVRTDFVTKEVAWFWLDNFDSQTFHSWVGFA